jgi:hypothetical protein
MAGGALGMPGEAHGMAGEAHGMGGEAHVAQGAIVLDQVVGDWGFVNNDE